VTASRMARLIALFERALETPQAQRAEFLERVTVGDPTLGRELVSLLEAHECSNDYLEQLAESVVAPTYAAVLDATPASARWDGLRIGAYRLLRELGRGGMSRVFLAERADGAFEQQVALKLLRPGFDTEVDVVRFRAERQILASLNHPNIARLLDGGMTEDELPYLVLEYVQGLPLDQHCQARGLSTRQRLGLFLTIADAVEYAHRRSIVHRDLKPSNILVTSDGVVTLLDFGLAKLLEHGVSGATATTRTAHRWMTPEYAAPEQVRGAPITLRTDVYQLGAVLYELLTGRPPFGRQAGSLHDFETAVLSREPDSLGGVLQRDLDAIVSKSLRKSPEDRYASAREFADDVRRYLTDHPVRARRQSHAYRARRFVIRHRLGLAAVAGVLLLLTASVTAVGIERARARRALASASGMTAADSMSGPLGELLAVADPDQRLVDTTEARRLLTRGLAEARTLSVEPERRARLLDAAGRVHMKLREFDSAFVCFQDALVIRRRLTDTRRANGTVPGRTKAAIASSVATTADPTRRKLLFVRPPGTVFMVDEDGTHEVRITDSTETMTAPAWAPDGRVLVSRFSGARGIYIVDPDGTGLTRITAPPQGWADYTPVAFGNRIVFARDSSDAGGIYRVNLDGTGLTRLTSGGNVHPSPKGDLIAFQRYNDIYVLDLRRGIERRLTNAPAQYKGVGGVSPDGRKILFTRIDPGRLEQIFVMNVDGTNTTRVSRGDYYDFLPRWSPDGKRIAFTSSRDGTNGVYTMRPDGSDVRDVSRTPLTLAMRPGITVLNVNETLWAWAK
jgi:hypothetical protein